MGVLREGMGQYTYMGVLGEGMCTCTCNGSIMGRNVSIHLHYKRKKKIYVKTLKKTHSVQPIDKRRT